MSHDLVPEMAVLPGAEKERVLKKFGIAENQLPKILASDPAVVALKANSGDVLKIHREDPSGKYLCYKLVV